jgi:hypothetical protein
MAAAAKDSGRKAAARNQNPEMKTALTASFLLLVCRCFSADMPQATAERIASAIFITEGGAKAKVPYGVLSVKVKNEVEARRVCINTVKHAWRDFEAGDGIGDFISFLADRYCPKKTDPAGNAAWKKNMKKLWKRKQDSAG